MIKSIKFIMAIIIVIKIIISMTIPGVDARPSRLGHLDHGLLSH